MNAETELWLFAVSVGASTLGGMLGMASGIFILPIVPLRHIRRDPAALGPPDVGKAPSSCARVDTAPDLPLDAAPGVELPGSRQISSSQRGSRNPWPPGAVFFWRRYSA
jgi:hypothetical protein